MIEVQGPNGSVIEFPDGTSNDVMLRAMQQHFGGQASQPAETPPQLASPDTEAGGAVAPAGAPVPPQTGAPAGPSLGPVGPDGKPQVGWMEGIGGSVASGISSDFADEIAGGALGAMGDKRPYEDRIKDVRGRLKAFEQEHPIVDFVGKAAGGLMSPLNKLGGGPIIGGLIGGAVSGFGSGEDGLQDRLWTSATGAGIGGATGGLLGVVGSAARGLKNFVWGPDSERAGASLLQRVLERDGTNIDDVISNVTGARAPLNVADTGRNTARLARTVESTPSEGSRLISDELTSRQEGSADRIGQLIRDYVNPGSANHALRELQEQRRVDARPAYQRAFSYGPVHNDRIVEMLGDPNLRRGLRRGMDIERTLARADGRPFNLSDYAITGFDDAGDPIMGPVPNMRMLDAAKRGLDDILDEYRNPVTQRLELNEQGNAINRLRRNFLQQIDDLNPAYAEARNVYAGPSRSIAAIRSGRDFLTGDIEDMEIRFRDLSPTDREFFVMGMARELRDMARNNSSDTADATRKILSGKTRDRLRTFLGDDTYNDFVGQMTDERRMTSTLNVARGNSVTARALMDQGDAAAHDQKSLSFMADLLSWGPKTAAANVVRRGYNRAQGMSEGTADWLAPRLLADNHRDLSLLKADLEKYLKQRQTMRNMGTRLGTAAGTAVTDALVR